MATLNRKANQFWLVVEDDDNDFLLFRRACARALDPQPIIHWEKHGIGARSFLTGNSNLPNLVFSDVKMPLMDGFQLLAWVRQQAPLQSLRFVMLTNSCAEKDIAVARQLGADDYRVKPTEMQSLVQLVKEVSAGIQQSQFLIPNAPYQDAFNRLLCQPQQRPS